MKPLTYLLLSVLCLNCSKQNQSIGEQLLGKWELQKSVGGWGGTINYSPGNGNVLEFTKINYVRYTNGQLSESGAYSIIKDTIWGSIEDRIIYNNDLNAYPKIFVRIANNQLSFYSNIIDAGSNIYQKIK